MPVRGSTYSRSIASGLARQVSASVSYQLLHLKGGRSPTKPSTVLPGSAAGTAAALHTSVRLLPAGALTWMPACLCWVTGRVLAAAVIIWAE